MHSVFSYLTLLLFLAAPVGFAQVPDDVKVRKAEILTLTDSGVIEDLSYVTVDGVSKLSIYSRGFAPSIAYKGPEEIVFFRPISNPNGFDGEEAVRKIVGKVKLPATATRILLLFEKKPSSTDEEEEAYRILALDNDLQGFPAGAYRFVNVSPIPVRGFLGRDQFDLKPNASKIMEAKGDSETGNVELKLFRMKGDTLEKIYSSVWNVNKRRRSTVFLSASQSGVQDVDVRKIVEPLPPEE